MRHLVRRLCSFALSLTLASVFATSAAAQFQPADAEVRFVGPANTTVPPDYIVMRRADGSVITPITTPDGTFQLDREDDPTITDAELRAHAILPGQAVTYTCVPPGSGRRIGVDRDEDGFFDRDELDEGTDPADASSFPLVPIGIRATSLTLRDDPTPPVNPNGSKLAFRSAKLGVSPSGVVVPAPGGAADPTSALLRGALAELDRDG